jgi:hypothetical protein
LAMGPSKKSLGALKRLDNQCRESSNGQFVSTQNNAGEVEDGGEDIDEDVVGVWRDVGEDDDEDEDDMDVAEGTLELENPHFDLQDDDESSDDDEDEDAVEGTLELEVVASASATWAFMNGEQAAESSKSKQTKKRKDRRKRDKQRKLVAAAATTQDIRFAYDDGSDVEGINIRELSVSVH